MADYGFTCSETVQIPIIPDIYQHNISNQRSEQSSISDSIFKKMYYIIKGQKKVKIVPLSLKTKLTAILQKI